MVKLYKYLRKQQKYIAVVLVLLLLSSAIIFIAQQVMGSTRQVHSIHHILPTATPTPVLSPSATPQPLFTDNFTDNSKGWYTGDVSGYTRIISDSGLTLAVTNHKVLTESLPTNDTFDDFTVTTTFTLLNADEHDSVGLYVRGDSNLDHDYRVEVFGNNTYAISKEVLDTNDNLVATFLVPPTHTSLLKPIGQPNILTVTMKGPTLLLCINNSRASAATDTDYTRGQIALFVENGNTSNGVTATFSSITVY